MTIKQYQEEVDKWAQQFKKPYWSPISQLTQLTEEVGELAREINNVHGERPKKPTDEKNEIKSEIGDVLFVIMCIANNLNINLDEAFEKTIEKYNIRDKDRHERKD